MPKFSVYHHIVVLYSLHNRHTSECKYSSILNHSINHIKHSCFLWQVSQQWKNSSSFRWFGNRDREYTNWDVMADGIWEKFKALLFLKILKCHSKCITKVITLVTEFAAKKSPRFHYKGKSCSKMKQGVTRNNEIHSNGMDFANIAAVLYDSAVALISYCRL
jgi:hypothetical protein